MTHSHHLVLLFLLFVLPRILQRFCIPTAITSFLLGAACSLQFDLFTDDQTVKLLSTLGIVSLFLFAGLDVEFRELRRNASILLQHVTLQVLSIGLLASCALLILRLDIGAATLVALAVLTPSTGFILDALGGFGLPERIRFWIKSKAIAAELIALALLFATLQMHSARGVWFPSLYILAMIAFVPIVFRVFAAVVLPWAPKSEFAFLMMMAVACGVITHELGVYYLVGAFLVGIAAQRLRERLPAMASERMLSSVEAFSSLFVPFYFFNAGLQLRSGDLSGPALAMGLALGVVGIALRLASIWLHRRIVLHETARESLRVSVPMMPTLVFTLVIATILRERFDIDKRLYGGLIVYAILNSLIPGLVFRRRLPEIEDELLQEEASTGRG